MIFDLSDHEIKEKTCESSYLLTSQTLSIHVHLKERRASTGNLLHLEQSSQVAHRSCSLDHKEIC